MEVVNVAGRNAVLRSLPGVDEVLGSDEAVGWLALLPRTRVVSLVRAAVEEIRTEVLSGRKLAEAECLMNVKDRVSESIDGLLRNPLRPVINASGVILHTNLGRAPLGQMAIDAVVETAGAYTNLEYDLATGLRGKRDVHCGELIERLVGAPGIVVNNNAAAVFLVLNELARGGEVVVSRGELIEIGDGFRIPDILEASQAILREVGTTNRTRIGDYRRAIGPETKALIRIHPSNFRQIGFTGRVSRRELAALARSESLPLVEDLGSGYLEGLERSGIEREPTVGESLAAGVDIVTFSGDKLLGGPQAGIIAGRPELVRRIRRNPLFRALRVDKLTLAALSATLRTYLAGRPEELPALRFALESEESLEARARRLVKRLKSNRDLRVEAVPGRSVLGGGSTPMQSLPSVLVAVLPPGRLSAGRIQSRLRANEPPVIARIEKDRVLLDLRTVFEREEDSLTAAVLRATGVQEG